MSFKVNTNMSSMAAIGRLDGVTRARTANQQQLSSGDRIYQAATDPAGLAISERLKSRMRSSMQAKRNANDGVSMLQVAEGMLSNAANMSIRLREIAMQAASDTMGDADRAILHGEFKQIRKEINRQAAGTEFNGKKLLDGSGGVYNFQIGLDNNAFEDRLDYDSAKINASIKSLNIDHLNVTTKQGAQSSLNQIDHMMAQITESRTQIGAVMSRMESVTQNLDIFNENTSAGNSRIRDTDYAAATAERARLNIKSHASTAGLMQANTSGKNVLKLLE